MAESTPDKNEKILQDLFVALGNGKIHSIQDLSYATKHTWPAIKKYVKLILFIQSQPVLLDLGGKYKLKSEKEQATPQKEDENAE